MTFIALIFLALTGCFSSECPKCPADCATTLPTTAEVPAPAVEPEPEEERCYLSGTEYCELFAEDGTFLSLQYRTTRGNNCRADLKYIRCFNTVGNENEREYRMPISTTGGVCPVFGEGPIECPTLSLKQVSEPAG